ncbi:MULTISPECIES: shikimate kinase [Flavobacterium]|nr:MULTISPECIES: shikimate kinase [Flavobacterium]UUF17010.1 hypothetical protein NLJ00_19585 [Flavobacterium panici]
MFFASGSGVTTTGEALSKKLDIPYLDSDAYFWEKTQTYHSIGMFRR